MNSTLLMTAFWIGIGATILMDIWALFLKVGFSIPSLDYALVGRWMGHGLRGVFTHKNITQSSPITGEAIIGWTAHYSIGIIFAYGLLLIWGTTWAEHPSLLPALIVGVATLVFPFFILQPCFGLGIAASRLAHPHLARLKSVATHTVFGIGLYLSGLLMTKLLS